MFQGYYILNNTPKQQQKIVVMPQACCYSNDMFSLFSVNIDTNYTKNPQ